MPIKTQDLPRQGTLPFNRQSKGQTVEVPESAVESQVDYHLRADGATVLSTTVRYKLQTCPRCSHRFRPVGGYGATPGVPDRLVRLDNWPRGVWLGLELKGSKTRLSPEQKLLFADGAIYVCRTGDQAREALALADKDLSWVSLRENVEVLGAAIRSRSLRSSLDALETLESLLN